MAGQGKNRGSIRLKGLCADAGDAAGAWLSVLAALIWIGQAAAVSAAVARLADPSGTGRAAIWWGGMFLALGLLRAGLDYVAAHRLTGASEKVASRLRRDLVSAEALRSPRDANLPAAGALAALAAEKAALVGAYVSRYRPAMLRVRVVPLAILACAAPVSWVVPVIFLVSGPLIPVFMALVGLAAREASERHMAEIASLNTMLLDRLRALVDIRLLDAGAGVTESFARAADDLRARTMAVLRIAFLSSAVLELFAAIGVALVAVYVGFTLLGVLGFGTWGAGLSLGEGLFLILLAPAYFEPLRDLAAAWHDKAAAEAVAAEVAGLERQGGPTIAGSGGLAARLGGPATISFRGVSVAAGGRPIPYPDFDLAAGATLALVGPSGSGKTTALAAMAGLATPVSGQVLVGGQPLSADNADAWRARLGWLPQDPHFLAASLRRNLAPGPVAAAGMDLALRQAHADEVVARLPRGLGARLGERGAGVSGGEARRLMLARVILAGPDLILADEPTADLDEETARAVTDTLLQMVAAGAGLVVATHDPRLAARMSATVRLGMPADAETHHA